MEARLDEIAPESPQGLVAPPSRARHFLTAANDWSSPAEDIRRLSDRDMKEILTCLTRRDRAA